MNKKINIISVGCGWVSNTRHLPALTQSELFNVTGVVSIHSDRASNTARRFSIKNSAIGLDLSKSWQSEAEAVMVGTNPQTHYEVVKSALSAGKHVLCEKPLTVDPSHCTELATIAKEKNLILAVVHNFQFSRSSMRFRKMLAENKVGKIRALYGVQVCNHERHIHDWCDQLPLGLFYDEAPHFYYMLRWLSGGSLELLNANVWKNVEGVNTPKVVSGQYKAASGIPVFLHINFNSSITEWHITAVCDKATVVIDMWRDILVVIPNDGAHAAKDILRTSISAMSQHTWGVITGGLRYVRGRHLYGNDEVVRRFYKAIQGESSLQGMDASEGCKVVNMQHELINRAVYHSA